MDIQRCVSLCVAAQFPFSRYTGFGIIDGFGASGSSYSISICSTCCSSISTAIDSYRSTSGILAVVIRLFVFVDSTRTCGSPYCICCCISVNCSIYFAVRQLYIREINSTRCSARSYIIGSIHTTSRIDTICIVVFCGCINRRVINLNLIVRTCFGVITTICLNTVCLVSKSGCVNRCIGNRSNCRSFLRMRFIRG